MLSPGVRRYLAHQSVLLPRHEERNSGPEVYQEHAHFLANDSVPYDNKLSVPDQTFLVPKQSLGRQWGPTARVLQTPTTMSGNLIYSSVTQDKINHNRHIHVTPQLDATMPA